MNTTPEPPHRARDRIWELVDRHGDDYLQEGKRLLRRARRTVTIVGIVIAAAAIAVAAVAVYAVLR